MDIYAVKTWSYPCCVLLLSFVYLVLPYSYMGLRCPAKWRVVYLKVHENLNLGENPTTPPSFSISLSFKTWRPLLEVNKRKRVEKEVFFFHIWVHDVKILVETKIVAFYCTPHTPSIIFFFICPSGTKSFTITNALHRWSCWTYWSSWKTFAYCSNIDVVNA